MKSGRTGRVGQENVVFEGSEGSSVSREESTRRQCGEQPPSVSAGVEYVWGTGGGGWGVGC